MIKAAMDRRMMLTLGAAAVSLVLLLGASIWSGSAASRLAEIKRAHAEMQEVESELKSLQARVEKIERRTAASRGKGLATVVEGLAASVGIKDKLTEQRTLSSSQGRERAELTFEKVSLNEVTNLLYRADGLPEMLLVNKVRMAPSFESPDLMMLDMTVSLITPGE